MRTGMFPPTPRLIQERNIYSSQSYRLPPEILVEIFLSVIYSPLEWGLLQSASMEHTLFHMLRNLHSVQSVCRLWRDIIVSQGSFWYYAPIYCSERPLLTYTRAPNLPLERAKGNLHLAAFVDFNPGDAISALRDISRFCKINLSTKSRSVLVDLLDNLLSHGSPLALSELSLHQERDPGWSVQDTFIPIFSNSCPKWQAFCKALKNISVLRIRGVQFIWNQMTQAFSDRLVELRLQDVSLGTDSEFMEFLNRPSSAPKLRDLKIISIQTSFDIHSLMCVRSEDQAVFPSLESLYLEDLPYNSLITVFNQIAPESYRMTLHLTKRYIEIDGSESEVGLETLCIHLKSVPVDALIIAGEPGDEEWLSPTDIHNLLRSVPELDTLKMNYWNFHEEVWLAILPPEDEEPEQDFPGLECLELSRVTVLLEDEELLKEVVESHPIQRMVLGGHIGTGSTGESENSNPLQENEPIIGWLRDNVPDFTLTDHAAQSSEFLSSVWQLWH